MSWRALAGRRRGSRARDFESAAGFDDGEDCCDSWSGLLMTGVGPVATADGHGAHGVLREFIAQLELRIFEEARELVPQPKSRGSCLAEWT